MSGGGKQQTIGYQYYVGMHMVLLHGPIDNISKFTVDGREAWQGSTTGGTITIDKPELFGGLSREGGISGSVDIALGGPTQTPNAYLQSKIQSVMPAFRGVVSVILKQVYVGLNPYLKPWSFRATRIMVKGNGSNQWYSAKAAIGLDMNPAHIIRECLTDSTWGLGYNESDIDDNSFTSCADALYNENFGLSILWDKSTGLDDFITVILSHIEASLFVDRLTGKFRLKLIRADYNINSLLVLDRASVSKISAFKRKTVAELTNQISVVFWDASTGENNSITIQDTALVQQVRTTIGTSRQYPGISNATLAGKVAARDLKSFSTPTAGGTLYATRKAANLNIGDVFLINWPQYDLNGVAMRVVSIEFGSLEDNAIKIDFIEDIFSFGTSIYAAPTTTAWTSATPSPMASSYHVVMDSPYYEIAQAIGDSAAASLDINAAYLLASCVRPIQGSINAQLWVAEPTYTRYGNVEFCPTAVVTNSMSITATVIAINSAVDIDLVKVGSWAIINTEIVRIDAVSASSITVGRGCLDTVPVAIPLNSRIYFIDDYSNSDGVERVSGEVINVKMLPTTGLGTYPINSATALPITMSNRQYKPYPPGNFKFDGVAYPSTSYPNSSNISVSWSHRDRLAQTTATIYDTTASSIGPEAGTTYTLNVYNASNSLIVSYTNIVGAVQVVPAATLGANIGNIRFELFSVRGGVQSLQKHDWTINRLA